MANVSDNWRELEDELAAWRAARRTASLWWRDDDAVEPTPALDRLLGLAARHRVPIALAVIPARASRRLPAYLAQSEAEPSIFQHGLAHQNHAVDGQKKIELGGDRSQSQILEALARGAALMDGLFLPPSKALPVMVPPWNRFDEDLPARLPALGFKGFSAHGPRPARQAVAGLTQANSHVDIMHWPAPRGFLGTAESLGQLIRHLQDRRSGAVDADEPSGLLTHHLAHDEPAWAFLEELLPRLAEHPAVRWLDAETIFDAREHNAWESKSGEPGS